jgi:hypothetical protein
VSGDPADTLYRLGRTLSEAGQPDKAEAALAQAVALAPDRADIRCRLGEEYYANQRLDQALVQFALAEHLDPASPAIQANLGLLHQARGDLAGAVRRYRRALAVAGEVPALHVNLGAALLAGFDFQAGFREAEWRLRAPRLAALRLPAPRWSGEPLAGKHLLVYCELGFGDMIQFARFLPAVVARAGAVTLAAPPELAPLFAVMPGVTVMEARDKPPPADFCVSLVSLPAVLGSGLAEIVASVPYLPPPPGRRREPPVGTGLRVGVVWAPRPALRGDFKIRRVLDRRGCPFKDFAVLLRVPGITFVGLQLGADAALPAHWGLAVQDLSGALRDFADTAAVIASLDLVVGIDTAVLHLAGALGKPAWALLPPGQADYRWGVGAESSPWYPGMRLFRANAAGWPALVATVAAELEAVANGRGRLYPPPAWGWSPPRDAGRKEEE